MSTGVTLPFFALGVSPGPRVGAEDPEGKDALERLVRDGVNLVRLPAIDWPQLEGSEPAADQLPPTVQAAADQLDWARRVEDAIGRPVRVAVNLGQLSTLDGNAIRQRWLDFIVERFRHHPALGVWKALDEPNNPYLSDDEERRTHQELIAGYSRLREHDPQHPVWLTFAPQPARRVTARYFRRYRRAADVFAAALYPVSEPMGKHSGIRNRQPSAVGDFADRLTVAARERSGGGLPSWVWMVLQGAAWSGTIPRDERRRPIGPCLLQPTAAMVRYMTYQAIIHGAQGLLTFGMNVGLHTAMQPFGWDWDFWRGAVAPVLRELTAPQLAPALATIVAPDGAATAANAHQVGGAGSNQLRVDTLSVTMADGTAILLAARRERRSGEQQQAAVDLPLEDRMATITGQAEVCFEGRMVATRGSALRDTFLPHSVHVYRLRTTAP